MTAPQTGGIYVLDVKGAMPHRTTKHCVCVAVGAGKYIAINSNSRPEYDELKINASDYDFLNGIDRFISCFRTVTRTPDKIISKVGTLSKDDTQKLIYIITKSKTILGDEQKLLLADLKASIARKPAP